ncbi:AtpZ/AtpI family protein [Maridesulfovibrio salexigens]|uniref:F0F1-ATPase subunit n=1 Tax=Maridesulfovibrio salexigens (strain ATCC 14822 / DSM 2638 / NCIMB 8403 / VKM B-1763) TaxID=526222 RepID=C6BWL2_MARSD|nr:AtpZ/AtpI family protein [Maridesulfovibrio salexigens]ACS80292.1 F0F1-ATPase subunit [Maridesulfovibrio salexigens DSM 2638]
MIKREPDERKPDGFGRTVGSKEQRKIRAGQKGTVGAWSAFGAMGAVGWLVALPVVLGSLLGVWLDSRWPGKVNWTMAMLGAGLGIGCLFAGIWMNREKNKIIKERDDWEQQDIKSKDVEDDHQ